MDKEHGGVYTCLTRDGKVFSTDKSVWMQGRCAWTFSYLCRVYGKNAGMAGRRKVLPGLSGGALHQPHGGGTGCTSR